MNNLFIFIPIAIIGAFLPLIVFSHVKLNIEKGQKPRYSSTGGGQIGWVNFRGPFISLRLYEDFLVIGCGRKFVLPYTAIERVEVQQWFGTLSDRVRIIHQQPDVPERIIIGTFRPNEVKEIIDARLPQ